MASWIHTFPGGEREFRVTDGDPVYPATLKVSPHPVMGFQAQVTMIVDGELKGGGIYLMPDDIRDLRRWCDELLGHQSPDPTQLLELASRWDEKYQELRGEREENESWEDEADDMVADTFSDCARELRELVERKT